MIFIADEDIALQHVHFQLDPNKVEAVIRLNTEGWGIDFLADDESLSFNITFTPNYIFLLRKLLEELESIKA